MAAKTYAVFEVVSPRGTGMLHKVLVKTGTNPPTLDEFIQKNFTKRGKGFQSICKSEPFLQTE